MSAANFCSLLIFACLSKSFSNFAIFYHQYSSLAELLTILLRFSNTDIKDHMLNTKEPKLEFQFQAYKNHALNELIFMNTLCILMYYSTEIININFERDLL